MRYAKTLAILLGIMLSGILLAQAETQDPAVETEIAVAEPAVEAAAETTAEEEAVAEVKAENAETSVPEAEAKTETNSDPEAEAKTETNSDPEAKAKTETNSDTEAKAKTETNSAPEAKAETAETSAPEATAETETEKKQNEGWHFSLIHVIILLAILVYIGLRMIPGKGWKIAPAYLRVVLLLAAAFLTLTPFVWLICSAFKSKEVMMTYTFLPAWNHEIKDAATGEVKEIVHWFGPNGTLTLDNFRRLLTDTFLTPHGPVYFWEYIVNSLFLSCGITTINIFFSSMAGYALAKYRFKGRNIIIFIMLGSMMFPAMLFLAPLYEMVFKFGWMDSYLALFVPGAITVFGIFLFRQAMVGVPTSLLESARVDGASEFRIYWEITLPLVRPVTAAYCLITFLGTWNAFLQPQIFIQSQSMLPLPVVLNQYIGMYVQEYGIFLAGTLLAIIPPAILFFVLQKEFVAGLTSGATKG